MVVGTQTQGSADEFFSAAYRFISLVPSLMLSLEEQVSLIAEMSLAAFIGEKTFDFDKVVS